MENVNSAFHPANAGKTILLGEMQTIFTRKH